MTVKRTKRTMHQLRFILLAFLVAVIGSTSAFAQDDQEYKIVYNAALEAAKAKNYTEAYTQFARAVDLAQKAGDTDIVKSSNKVLAQLDYRNGKKAADADNYDDALTHFNKGIAHLATYPNNYLGKGLALKKLDRTDEAMATFMETIEVSKKASDSKMARAAESAIRDHYIYMASSTLSKSGQRATPAQATEAVGYLDAMKQYVEADSDTYFYMAVAQEAKGEFAQAIESAEKALEMHRGSRTDKAKIFFVKGEALMRSGDIAGAKTAFREAAFGTYKAPAEHYIETLGT